jgi:putative transcriptional regulator
MLALGKRRAKDLAAQIGITEANPSRLRSGKVKGVRLDTLARLRAALDGKRGDLLDNARGPEDDRPPTTPKRERALLAAQRAATVRSETNTDRLREPRHDFRLQR